MIKIIEPGTRTVAVCGTCGCKFSYEKEDIKENRGLWIHSTFKKLISSARNAIKKSY